MHTIFFVYGAFGYQGQPGNFVFSDGPHIVNHTVKHKIPIASLYYNPNSFNNDVKWGDVEWFKKCYEPALMDGILIYLEKVTFFVMWKSISSHEMLRRLKHYRMYKKFYNSVEKFDPDYWDEKPSKRRSFLRRAWPRSPHKKY